MRIASVAFALVGLAASSGAASPHARHGANFWVKCGFSHTSYDDPIVHPRRPGTSHAHTFFGNRSTNAFSTYRSLRSARTTCRRAGDTAAYWVPTLYRYGREVRPASVGVYYRMLTRNGVHPFPPGLRIVAGDASATRPQSRRITYWTCWMAIGPSPEPPNCPQSRRFVNIRSVLTLHVVFPECWDGKHLDSPDHHSHMAYADADLRCPRTHPVQVPGLALVIAYPIYDGRRVELASGGQFSAHADFINAWDQDVLRRLSRACSAATARADCADRVQDRK